MALSNEELSALLVAPRETLGVELKRWVDPKSDEGKAKIAKGCLALWNSGGGLFVVGFDDKTLQPDLGNSPPDASATFHVDVVQAIVGEFAAQPFPVEVLFAEREGQEYPIISVPTGVRTPVAAKRELSIDGKVVIKDHAVYVRSLSSNNTVSSSEPKRGDWERIVATWFDNREADIGGFVRRHLGGLDLSALGVVLGRPSQTPAPTAIERATDLLTRGRARFDAAVSQRGLRLPALGLREAAIVLDGEVPEHTATAPFLQRLSAVKPRYSGWSPWIASFTAEPDRDPQYVLDGGWEALIGFHGGTVFRGSLDFWRIDPRGEFYHLDAFQDDFHESRGIPPRTELDFRLQIIRVVEYITATRAFATAMGCKESGVTLACVFRWSGLKGRRLVSRQNPSSLFYPRPPATQDQVLTSVVIPLEVPPSGLAPYVQRAVQELFLVFGGWIFEDHVIEAYVREVLNSRY